MKFRFAAAIALAAMVAVPAALASQTATVQQRAIAPAASAPITLPAGPLATPWENGVESERTAFGQCPRCVQKDSNGNCIKWQACRAPMGVRG